MKVIKQNRIFKEGILVDKAEIKYSSTLKSDYLKTMNRLTNQLDLPDGKKFLLMDTPEMKKWMGADVKGWRELDF